MYFLNFTLIYLNFRQRKRIGRSAETNMFWSNHFNLQNIEMNCIKKLICVLNTQDPLENGNKDKMDLTSEVKASEFKCNSIFPKCPYSVKYLMKISKALPLLYLNSN